MSTGILYRQAAEVLCRTLSYDKSMVEVIVPLGYEIYGRERVY